MYVYYNPNPYGRFVGDCVVRAVSKVTGQSVMAQSFRQLLGK
jgi:hypothetical protein